MNNQFPSSASAGPHYSVRSKPAQGVRIDLGKTTFVLITVCTKNRQPWLACNEAHTILRNVWLKADAWLVGDYVLMSGHLHMFAAPRDLQFTIDRWITFWKSHFSKGRSHSDWAWQTSAFHHRLRDDDNYHEKWIYVQENPIRAGLVKQINEWPFQGTIHALRT